jgi:mono/diheme cytochrome c family protein
MAMLAAMSATVTGARAETLMERGTYLMSSIVACGNCHSTRGKDGFVPGMEMAGGLLLKEKVMTAFAPNITPDRETGIGAWTDAQIIIAIREGKRPDGSIIGPPMPIELYRGLSDDDAKALVAYLRALKPVRNKVPKSVYRIPLPPSYGPPVGHIATPPKSDKLRYGAYLAGPLGHCMECHTPMIGGGRRDYAERSGAGGFHFSGPWGEVVSANLTPDRETGLGKWSDAEIKRAITSGVRADGSSLSPPMGYGFYKNISGADLDALVAYLRSLKPVNNKVR